jgi:hypothetical protein
LFNQCKVIENKGFLKEQQRFLSFRFCHCPDYFFNENFLNFTLVVLESIMRIASSSPDSTQVIKFYVQNNTLFIGKKQICSIEIPSDVLFLSFGCFDD